MMKDLILIEWNEFGGCRICKRCNTENKKTITFRTGWVGKEMRQKQQESGCSTCHVYTCELHVCGHICMCMCTYIHDIHTCTMYVCLVCTFYNMYTYTIYTEGNIKFMYWHWMYMYIHARFVHTRVHNTYTYIRVHTCMYVRFWNPLLSIIRFESSKKW